MTDNIKLPVPRPAQQPLTDEQIYNLYRHAGLEIYHIRDDVVLRTYDKCINDFARAIEAAATAPLLERIAELEAIVAGQIEMYLNLTDAMGYTSGKDGLEFSPEEYANHLRSTLAKAQAAPQPAQQDDDEGDALTIAYLHGHGKGKDSVQPVLSEKDALLRQSLEALVTATSEEGFEQHELNEARVLVKAIRTHLGVKND